MKKLLISMVAMAVVVPGVVFASIDANLKYGSRGVEVTELQEFLIDKGFLTGQTSGNFFALTRKAVIVWQASVGLPATGFVGSMSRAKINEDLSTANAPAVSAEVAETGTTSLTQTSSSVSSFTPGCTSLTGFSVTTGKSCSASVVASNTIANKTITFPNGSIAEVDSRGDIVRWLKEAAATIQSTNQVTQNQTSTDSATTLSILLSDTTTTVNSVHLSWSTNIPTDSKVFVTPPSGIMQVVPSASGYSTQHFVDIPNLAANTRYSYMIEATNNTQDKKLTRVINTNTLPTPTVSIISAVPQTSPVAVNMPNQWLGGMSLTITNEPVVIESMRFNVVSSNPNATLMSISLTCDGGNICSGPVDKDTTSKTFTFTDHPSLPSQTTGLGWASRIDLMGKIFNGQVGDTITITTNPATDWVVQGKNSGIQASLPNTMITLPVTIKGPAISIGISTQTNPASTILKGSRGDTAYIMLDASKSAEDMRMTGIPIQLTASGSVKDLSNCQLYNGSTALNTGSFVLNPNNASNIFSLDRVFTIPQGSITTLSLRCDVASYAPLGETFAWSFASNDSASAIGTQSGQFVNANMIYGDGPTVVVVGQ